MDKTPNHICKNPRCSKGSDGGPMHYWACNNCDKRNSWRAAACSEECYGEYLDAIAVARGSKVVETDDTQRSMFDEPVLAAETDAEDTAPAELMPKQNIFQNYSKKNKHYR